MANYFDKYDESAPTGNYFDKYDEPEKKADGGDFLRGAKESFQQLPQLGYGLIAGAGAALENVAGEGGIATGIKKAGIAGYKDWGDTIAKGSKESDSWDYSYEQAKQGNFGSLVDWLQHGLGYVGGQAVQTLATGGIGYAGGKFAANTAAKQIAEGMVAKEAAKLTAENAAAKLTTEQIAKQATANVAAKFAAIGQTSALAANAVGMEGGEILGGLTSENADRPLTGAELGKAFVATLAAGGLEFVGDKLGLDIMLGKSALLKPAEKATGILGRAARGGIAAAGAMPIEGGTEFGQTLLEEYGKGKDPFSADAMKQARESAALGALGGMAIGGVGGAIRGPKVDEQKPADTPAAPVLQIGNTPEDILKAPDADSAIATFAASLTGTDMGALMGQENPLIGASRDMQAQAAADQAELADLAQSEARDLNTMRAMAVEDARKQRELDALQATGTGLYSGGIDGSDIVQVEGGYVVRPKATQADAVPAPVDAAPAVQPAASGVPAQVDPSQSINQPLNQEIQSATQADQAVQSPPQRQEPTARAAPVPAPVPDPVQPAEGSTVPAQAQTDPRLIPVSKRAPAQPTEGPGSDAGNGFKQGPKQGERYRVGVVAAAGGAVSLEKRLPAGTAATFYVGKDGSLIDGDSVNFIGTGRDKLWIPATPEQAQQAQAILDEMGRLALNDPARQAAKARLKALVLQGNTNAGAPNAADVARPGGQRADDRSGSDGVAGVPDQRPSDVLASPAATEGQEAAGQEPTAGPAPVPAVNPDPVQPAESGAVPAQAKDQRLIPVSRRGGTPLTPEENRRNSIDAAGSELAGQFQQESAEQDFDPKEAMQAIKNWAEGRDYTEDELRAAVVSNLGKSPNFRRKAGLLAALNKTTAPANPRLVPVSQRPDKKAQLLKNVADSNRLNGPTGVQIGGLVNGRINFLGDPGSSKQARALRANVDEALKAGATPQEIVEAATGQPSKPADAAKAKEDLKAAVADLGSILTKKGRATLMPEEEQKIMPVLVRLFDAAFRLGYANFKDAAKYALEKIRETLGADVADSLTNRDMQDAHRASAAVRSNENDNRTAVVVGAKPGEFKWDFTAPTAPPPFALHPSAFPRLEKIGEATHTILKSSGFKKLVDDMFGVKGLEVAPLHGSWEGKPEPSFGLYAPGLTFEQSDDMSKMLGMMLAQDATVVTQPTAEESQDEIPVIYIGSTKKLTDTQLASVVKSAKELGVDYSTSLDGKAVKFLHFGDADGLSELMVNAAKVASDAGLGSPQLFYARSSLNEASTYTQERGGGAGDQAWHRDTPEGPSDLFRRAVDHVLVPYAKAVAAEGYTFSVQRYAERFGLSPAQQRVISEALAPRNGASKATSSIMRLTDEQARRALMIPEKKANVSHVLMGLQNSSAQQGLIEPGDYSDKASKLIAQALTDEVLYHVNEHGGKSAIGWYDRALKAAKKAYMSVFPEISTDKNKSMLFDALLGIASQGNDVFSNSLFAGRMYVLLENGKTIPEAVKLLRGSFGGETRAIENNYLKLHELLERNGYDTMRAFFNKKATVGEINAILRSDTSLHYDGKPLQADGAARQTVTGWSVFGPKIGSFINNLHGDYSTLTADLWFSRTWNRILGYSFVHAPALEADQYQKFIKALVAESSYHAGTLSATEPKNYNKKGEPIYYEFGKDAAGMDDASILEVIDNPEAALALATKLEAKFRKGGYKEKSDLLRAAKVWVENRNTTVALPRTDNERTFQQETAERTQKMLKAKGLDISIADIQAALWYHEKDLFKKLGVSTKRSEAADYEDAAKKLVSTMAEGKLFWNEADERKVLDDTGIEYSRGAAQESTPTNDTPKPTTTAFARSRPFYSALSSEISGINAKAMTPGDWGIRITGLIKAGKVKADEVEWSGLSEFLKLQTGKVTKEQVTQFLDANGVKVEETVLAGPGLFRDVDEAIDYVAERYAMTPEEVREEYGYADEQDYIELARSIVDDKPDQTKYGRYQLPGGTNYREVLLTLPEPEPSFAVDDFIDAMAEKYGRDAIYDVDGQINTVKADFPAMLSADDQKGFAAAQAEGRSKKAPRFNSSHWDQPNVLAHIRVNDRADADGKRVLFVEEIQSDWGQQGKKQGFKPGAAGQRRFQELGAEWDSLARIALGPSLTEDAIKAREQARQRQAQISDEMNAISDAERDGLPGGPFVTKTDAWLSLALKRIVKMAVDEGYDRVAFINGDQSAERYDLSKQVDSIKWRPNGVGGGRTVNIEIPSHGTAELLVNRNGQVVGSRGARNVFGSADGKQLDEVIGKEIAAKIMEDPDGDLSGNGLKVGGEGMKAFYDKIVPNTLKDVLRKVGGGALESVSMTTEMDGVTAVGRSNVRIVRNDGGTFVLLDENGQRVTMESFSTRAEAESARREAASSKQEFWQTGFTITPAMQEKAANGLPLFAKGSGRGVHIDDANAVVAAVREALPTAPPIHIMESVAQAPADLRKFIKAAGAENDVDAAYHNGEIYVFPANIPSIERMQFVLAHHEIRHHGLAAMLGPRKNAVMLKIHESNPAIRALAAEQVRKGYAKSRILATEEALADMPVSELVKLNGFDRIVAAVREWLRGAAARLRRAGLGNIADAIDAKTWTDKDVAALIARAEGVSRGGAARYASEGTVFDRNDGAMARTGSQTSTPAFLKWFGASKVVNPDGSPMVVYHGTKADFTEFKRTSGGEFGPAIYLTDSPREASEYGDGKGWGGPAGTMVMPVYASIKNPYTKGVDAFWKEFGTGGSDAEGVAAAQAAGYDGIIAKRADRYYDNDAREFVDRGGELTHYIAFSPTQIKSATGNRGTFDQANPDIRFARSAVTGKTITPTWQAPDPTRMDDMIYSMQDKHVDTKRVVTAVRDAIGGIADNLDPYLQEELYHGRAAMATKEFLEKSIRPLLTDMQARGVEMSDFEEYLHNRHAERRNDQVAKVNPNMPDGGSGIKTADARAYLAGLPAAKRTAYQALARRVDQMNRDTRALLVSSGLEKQSTIDAWQAAYGDEYVPLMREEMDNGAMGIGQGFSVRGSSSKRAMGSNKPVANIMANIALQREKAITRAEKRRIGEALYGMVLSAPNPDFWFAVDPALEQNPAQITATAMQLISMGLNPIDAQAIAAEPRQKYIDPRTGQVAERINPVLRSADNVLAVRIDGEDKYVFFNAADPRAMRMAKSLKNLDSDQLGVVMGNVAKMTRYFAAVNTQFNPVFGVVNLTRDIQTALLNLQSTGLAGKQVEVMKHVGSALRGIYIDLRDHRAGKTPTSTWAGLFEEFQREGGATGYRDMYANAQERADAIADELKKIKQGRAMEFGRGVFGWLSDYNESMENAVRLATYKVAKEQGMTNSQAASVAKNLTVNFNRKGQVALQAGAMYAFFNAAVQGTARMAETMFSGGKLSATGKKIMTGGLLLGSMQALLLAAAGYDDEEPPDFVRERSIVIPIGADKYVSIPMPLGFHVIPNLARIPTEWAMGGFKDTPKRLAQLVSLFADAFNPIGSAGLSLQTLAPTIIDPLAALAENKDWTGKQIAKKDFNSMQPTAGHTRAKDTATPWARAIAYGVNWVTGGTDYKPGMASPTPDQIDYLIGQATGGVGREASKLSQVASSTVSGEELPLYKIPLLGRFVGTTTGQAAESGRFYENLKEIGEHDAELSGLKKDRRMAEYQVYLRENPQARLVPIADRTYREVSKLIRMKREALKAGASKERVKMLDQQITARMAQFNARVKATETRETATQ